MKEILGRPLGERDAPGTERESFYFKSVIFFVTLNEFDSIL